MPGLARKRPRRQRSEGTVEADPEIKLNIRDYPPSKKLKVDDGGNSKMPIQVEEVPPAPYLRRSPNGYVLPDPLPDGLILKDLRGQRWRIGCSVGIGGFGEIYSACSVDASDTSNYVVKVEPHTNGPLFVEVNFYLRATTPKCLKDFKEQRGLDHLGVPSARGSGSFIYGTKRFRFLVLPRYGTDLQTILDESGFTLSIDSARSIACQVIDSYEYLHSKNYVHKDLKGSNLLFSSSSSKVAENPCVPSCFDGECKIFLVDYGLVSKYTQLGVHKPYLPDMRSAHEGTLEYASRDSHLGCFSRRGDVEVLVYNLIDWLGGKLPWDKSYFVNPKDIYQAKIRAFHDIKSFLSESFKGHKCPDFLEPLMNVVDEMKFEEAPDYNFLRQLLSPSRCCSELSPSSPSSASSDEVVLSLTLTTDLRAGVVACEKESSLEDSLLIIGRKLPRTTSSREEVKRSENKSIKKRVINADLEVEEEMQRLSTERFQKEQDIVIRHRCAESLLNPTPNMVRRMIMIRERPTCRSRQEARVSRHKRLRNSHNKVTISKNSSRKNAEKKLSLETGCSSSNISRSSVFNDLKCPRNKSVGTKKNSRGGSLKPLEEPKELNLTTKPTRQCKTTSSPSSFFSKRSPAKAPKVNKEKGDKPLVAANSPGRDSLFRRSIHFVPFHQQQQEKRDLSIRQHVSNFISYLTKSFLRTHK